jgi:N-acetylglucosaminylphosphatidylinositol deacetylase
MSWVFPLASGLAALAALAAASLALGARRFARWPGSSPSSSPALRALLVIAHPDDEAMFFVPLIVALRGAFDFSILCLSTGNADKLGAVRASELVASASTLGVPETRVAIVDRPDLQDGMQQHWDAEAVAALVRAQVRQCRADAVFTFDSGGVSGHPNHVAVWRGVATYVSGGAGGAGAEAEAGSGISGAGGPSSVPCYALETVSGLRKFLGPLDILVSWAAMVSAGGGGHGKGGGRRGAAADAWPDRAVVSGGLASQRAAHAAMRAHASQYVWFRRLFVAFSRYMFVNTVRRM